MIFPYILYVKGHVLTPHIENVWENHGFYNIISQDLQMIIELGRAIL